MANSADPDQLASEDLDQHCLQRQVISGFSRTRVKFHLCLGQFFSNRKTSDLQIWTTVVSREE